MESLLCELEFDMEALFNTNFHFDAWVFTWLFANVLHDEFFLFGDPVVVSVDHDVDEVA